MKCNKFVPPRFAGSGGALGGRGNRFRPDQICPPSLSNDWLIVEGLGGVLVPINPKQFMLE